MKVDGKWRLEEDVMKERGLVRSGGGWVTPGEAARIAAGEPSPREKARRERKALDRRLRKSLNAALRRVADPDPRTREKGEADLVSWAQDAGDPEFEARAHEVRAYYDRLFEEVERARALLTVRAQLVTLKRPIPTFRTSLGAASSPVTLQLPELSVVSINTTVVVPLQVDEED
jgi:acyl-CoA synthetase (AMP-forming)/AMP-acid ligase II